MKIFSWKILRLLIIGGIFFGNIWLLYWVIPSLGCFHLAGYAPLVIETRFSMVSFINGECTSIVPLDQVRIGWETFKELWPLFLLGVMTGYPFGEIVKWRCSCNAVEDIMQRKKGILSLEMFAREAKIKNMVEEANTRTSAMPKLQKKVEEQRAELHEIKVLIEKRKQDHEAATRKVNLLNNELTKARAHIRRLKKKQSPGKWVDAEPWSE